MFSRGSSVYCVHVDVCCQVVTCVYLLTVIFFVPFTDMITASVADNKIEIRNILLMNEYENNSSGPMPFMKQQLLTIVDCTINMYFDMYYIYVAQFAKR